MENVWKSFKWPLIAAALTFAFVSVVNWLKPHKEHAVPPHIVASTFAGKLTNHSYGAGLGADSSALVIWEGSKYGSAAEPLGGFEATVHDWLRLSLPKDITSLDSLLPKIPGLIDNGFTAQASDILLRLEETKGATGEKDRFLIRMSRQGQGWQAEVYSLIGRRASFVRHADNIQWRPGGMRLLLAER